jgi:hypothetical protein
MAPITGASASAALPGGAETDGAPGGMAVAVSATGSPGSLDVSGAGRWCETWVTIGDLLDRFSPLSMPDRS